MRYWLDEWRRELVIFVPVALIGLVLYVLDAMSRRELMLYALAAGLAAIVLHRRFGKGR